MPLATVIAWVGITIAQAHPGFHDRLDRIDEQLLSDPCDAKTWVARGELHRLDGHPNDAARDFAEARRCDPSEVSAWLGLGRAALALEHYADAADWLSAYLAESPHDGPAWFARGQALAELGDAQAAAESMAQAIRRFDPPTVDAYHGWIAALIAAEAIDAAWSAIDEATARFGDIVSLERAAISLATQTGRHSEALRRIDRWLDRFPDSIPWRVERAMTLESAGQPVAAAEAWTEAQCRFNAHPRRSSRGMLRLAEAIAQARARLPSHPNAAACPT